MISGGGQLWGTDSRNEEAVAAGTGGIGAITSYFAGLRSVPSSPFCLLLHAHHMLTV